jgi:hypothetical protein
MRLEWDDFHRAPHPSIYSVEWCGGTCRLQEAGGVARPLDAPPLHPRALVAPPRRFEDSTWWNLDMKSVVKSVKSSKCMTMGPWITVNKSCPLIKPTWMEASHWLTRRSHGSVKWQGHRWGRAVPLWGRAAPAYGPSACCHIHLFQMFMFVTILAYFCHIFLILQAQMELGEI